MDKKEPVDKAAALFVLLAGIFLVTVCTLAVRNTFNFATEPAANRSSPSAGSLTTPQQK